MRTEVIHLFFLSSFFYSDLSHFLQFSSIFRWYCHYFHSNITSPLVVKYEGKKGAHKAIEAKQGQVDPQQCPRMFKLLLVLHRMSIGTIYLNLDQFTWVIGLFNLGHSAYKFSNLNPKLSDFELTYRANWAKKLEKKIASIFY